MGLETLGLAAIAGGTVMKVAGSGMQSEAEAQSAEYNARITRMRAASERDSAEAEATDSERHGAAKVEENVANIGAAGITMEGSPLAVTSSVVKEIALGTARIRHGGEKRAIEYENSAKLYDARADNARTAGNYKIAGDILSGVTSFAKFKTGGGAGSGGSAVSEG